ncbi:hypothetical protein K9L27_01735 [Candidatus Gracilibacteria bacterium]|nr:hypothetical protein [Candidatus Gracilibacteria bacterium]
MRITEISPRKIGIEEEWFEFTLQSDIPIDISNWKISNTKSTKTFLEKKDDLITPIGITMYTGSGSTVDENQLVFLLPKSTYFTWRKSPISLTDSGGTIQILNADNEILDEISYPDTKIGTQDGEVYSEIWNRKSDTEVFPLIYRTNDSSLRHTKGIENDEYPASTEDIEFFISEISPDRDTEIGSDFIELFIQSANTSPINLRYLEVKHNGTPLMFLDSDFWAETGDFIVIQTNGNSTGFINSLNPYFISTDKKDGISAGSGNVEVILYSGTSREKTEDFVCWKNGDLSDTETIRVEKNVLAKNWSGDCIDISKLISNESIARNTSYIDTNTKDDFFRHFNGSFGQENISQNHTPIAKIEVQGGLKIFKGSLNFTGDKSTDPDGTQDIEAYLWQVNGVSCPDENANWHWKNNCEMESVRINPDRIYFDELGTYAVSLTVTDFSGTIDTTTVTIEVTEEGINPFYLGSGSASSAFSQATKKWLEKELSQSQKNILPVYDSSYGKASDDFFADFLIHVDIEKLQNVVFSQTLSHFHSYEPPVIPLFQRDKFSEKQKHLIAKNIGFIFLE